MGGPVIAETAKATLFNVGRVFDGEQVLRDRSVLVVDGVIAEVGERLDAPAGAQVVDAGGQMLLPGLIDAHTHVFADSPAQAVVFGVTTELDMFADPTVAAELKAVARDRPGAADVRSAGTCATAPGGHPTGLVERGFYRPFPTITEASEAEAFVAARAAEGSDYLKIIVDDGHVLGYTRPTLGPDTVAALIVAAHRHGLLAIVHALDAQAARLAVVAGADGLAHLPMDVVVDVEFTRVLADRGVFVTPTLVALEAISGHGHGPAIASDPRFEPWLGSSAATMLTMLGGNFPLGPDAPVTFEAAANTLAAMRRAGAAILAGSDAGTLGVAHGASLHRELELLVGAGLSALEALRAATAAPAAVVGLHDRGRIQPGLTADLLLIDGDPTTDITETANIAGIWRRGCQVVRQKPAPAHQ